ncbi:hypothetical protein CFC21_107166, partial [Triticum aestivum]
TPTTSISNPK